MANLRASRSEFTTDGTESVDPRSINTIEIQNQVPAKVTSDDTKAKKTKGRPPAKSKLKEG